LSSKEGLWSVDLTNYRIGSLVSYLVRYGIRKYNEFAVTNYITSIPRDIKICRFFKSCYTEKHGQNFRKA